MKHLLVILLLALAPLLTLNAQPEGGKDEAMVALKMAFITRELNLTPEEAQKFWPVYNQYTQELRKMRKEHTGDELELREKSLNLTKRFKPEFIKCVGPNRFNRLLKSEGEWRQVLKDEINRRRQLHKQLKNKPGGEQ